MKIAVTYTFALESGSVSIRFSRKPRLSARDLIKSAGLRWNPDALAWTGRPADPEALREGLRGILGDALPDPVPAAVPASDVPAAPIDDTRIPEDCEALTVNGVIVAVTHTEDLTASPTPDPVPAPAPAPEYASPAERLMATRPAAMDGVRVVHIAGASTTYDLFPARLLSLNCDQLKTVDTVTNSIVDDEEAENVYAQLLSLFKTAADAEPKKYAPRLRCIVKCCNDRLPA